MTLVDAPTATVQDIVEFLTDWPIFLPFWCPHENTILKGLTFGPDFFADFAHIRANTPGARWHFFRICDPKIQLVVDGDARNEFTDAADEVTKWHKWFTDSPNEVMETMPYKTFMQSEYLDTEPEINLVVGRGVNVDSRPLHNAFALNCVRLKTYDDIAENIDQPWWHRDKALHVSRATDQGITPISHMRFRDSYSFRKHDQRDS